ncbi:hypothetical protein NL676_002725 [Syzygium grande]|nr:hypothetical protein NL676_002725 [Syzygium grande]
MAISQHIHEDLESYNVEPPKRPEVGIHSSKEKCFQLMLRTMAKLEIDPSGSIENQEKIPYPESPMHGPQNKYMTVDRRPPKDDVLVDKNIVNDEAVKDDSIMLLASGSETKEVMPSSLEFRNSDDLIAKDDVAQEERRATEKGLKRKTFAKRPESLAIATAIEFPAGMASCEGQVYSPRAYTTREFSTYSLPKSENLCEASKEVFTKELVIAFEEHMQELEAEETIPKRIAEKLEREGAKENLDEVATT